MITTNLLIKRLKTTSLLSLEEKHFFFSFIEVILDDVIITLSYIRCDILSIISLLDMNCCSRYNMIPWVHISKWFTHSDMHLLIKKKKYWKIKSSHAIIDKFYLIECIQIRVVKKHQHKNRAWWWIIWYSLCILFILLIWLLLLLHGMTSFFFFYFK